MNPANEPLTSQRRLPAWALSLALHAALMTALAFCVGGSAISEPPPAPRQVGIVLTAPTPDRATEYFQDTDPESARESVAASATSAPTPPSEEAAEDRESSALPSGAATPNMPLPDIQLPGAAPSVGGDSDLLIPDLTMHGRGRTAILPGLGDEAILAEEAARRAARASLGSATKVSIFGSESAVGRSFVFAIDRSKSMGGDGLNALEAARTELTRALEHLAGNHRFQVVAYHHQCVYLQRPRLLPATRDNKAAVGPFIGGLAALGGTGHDMAVRVSLALEPDAVFLLTDGGDPYLNDVQLAYIRKMARDQTSIHCIRFGFGPPAGEDHFMVRLARQNGGSYTYVNMSSRRP